MPLSNHQELVNTILEELINVITFMSWGEMESLNLMLS